MYASLDPGALKTQDFFFWNLTPKVKSMDFHDTIIVGLRRVTVERLEDARGSFGRTFSRNDFEVHGLAADFVQASSSKTSKAGSLRGMHMQLPPHSEAKLVHCVRGAIHDVVCDLRIGSPSYLRHQSFRLDQDGDSFLHIPAGCVHGFQTLVDDVEVLYAMTAVHRPESAIGLRYDDPELGIDWPLSVTCISPKDLGWDSYRAAPWRSAVQFEAHGRPAGAEIGGAA